ncbi:hypothetical protein D9M73_140270 [compost metagenome]
MVRRVVGVAERHAVIGDVIFAVLKAADLRLGFGQADTVIAAIVGNARRDQRDLVEVDRRRQRILDERARDDRLRLRRLQRRRNGCELVGLGRGNDDVGAFGDVGLRGGFGLLLGRGGRRGFGRSGGGAKRSDKRKGAYAEQTRTRLGANRHDFVFPNSVSVPVGSGYGSAVTVSLQIGVNFEIEKL